MNFPTPPPTSRPGLLVLAIILMLGLTGCDTTREIRLSGKTMGTVYHITVLAPFFSSAEQLEQKINQRLEKINQRLSTYDKDTEISRFNALDQPGKSFRPSTDLAAMIQLGQKLSALTDGAWDGTIRPLVRLWGFDDQSPPSEKPDQAAIDKALQCVGFDQIQVLPSGEIVKQKPCLVLDFASIAKGYGVDQLVALLRDNGLYNFIVEIGGEVFAAGTKKDGRPWRVGINLPDPAAPVDLVRRSRTLSDQAIATSGDYRNFFTINDTTYCHVLDPQTGYPVTTGIVSASVTAATCALADGLATALMVMGVPDGLDLINSLAGTECLITVRHPDGSYRDYYSNQFKTEGDPHE